MNLIEIIREIKQDIKEEEILKREKDRTIKFMRCLRFREFYKRCNYVTMFAVTLARMCSRKKLFPIFSNCCEDNC